MGKLKCPQCGRDLELYVDVVCTHSKKINNDGSLHKKIMDNYSRSYKLFSLILNGIGMLLLMIIMLENMNVFSGLDRTIVILIVIVGIIGILINYILEIRKINNDEKQKN